MKKSALLLLSLFLAAVLPASADLASKRKELVARVETCEAILQEFMGRPETAIPQQVLAQAKALVVVNQLRAGVVLGVQDGWAVILVKRADGTWSLPALLGCSEASLGLQLGVNRVEMVYVITDDETARMLFKSRFNVGVDAKAVAGPRSAEAQKTNKPILTAPVLVYSKRSGLYAGATVKTGYLARDDEANRLLYNTRFNYPELVYSDWVQPIPEVEPLRALVRRLVP